jgi:hypothetical protein
VRYVFEDHRAKKAVKEHQEAVSRWQAERDGAAELLTLARTFEGEGSSEILLGSGELLFCKVMGAALIEERRGSGHYQGRSQGVSIPVASIGGRSIRYHVGANKGTFVQGTPVVTAIDTGTVFISNKRVIFQGTKQTRECMFAKLIGFQHDESEGSTTFSVSNRQKPTTVLYGTSVAGAFDFRLDLALAHFKGTVAELVTELQNGLDEIDKHCPPEPAHVAPTPPTAIAPPKADPATTTTPTAPVPTFNAGWYADPWKLAALRWWDGCQWTGDVHDESPTPAP